MIPVPEGSYSIALNTDTKVFGGYGLVDDEQVYTTLQRDNGDAISDEISLYLPPRTALVLRRK